MLQYLIFNMSEQNILYQENPISISIMIACDKKLLFIFQDHHNVHGNAEDIIKIRYIYTPAIESAKPYS